MNIPQNLPITPLQSKAARYQLGLTQANVIQDSSLPGHKLKGFETGRLIPDMKFLEGLANFYQAKGIELSELTEVSIARRPRASRESSGFSKKSSPIPKRHHTRTAPAMPPKPSASPVLVAPTGERAERRRTPHGRATTAKCIHLMS